MLSFERTINLTVVMEKMVDVRIQHSRDVDRLCKTTDRPSTAVVLGTMRKINYEEYVIIKSPDNDS